MKSGTPNPKKSSKAVPLQIRGKEPDSDMKPEFKPQDKTETQKEQKNGSLFDYFKKLRDLGDKPDLGFPTRTTILPKVIQLPRAEPLSSNKVQPNSKRKREAEPEDQRKKPRVDLTSSSNLVVIGDESEDDSNDIPKYTPSNAKKKRKSSKASRYKPPLSQSDDESVDLDDYEEEDEQESLDILYDEDADGDWHDQESSQESTPSLSLSASDRAIDITTKEKKKPLAVNLIGIASESEVDSFLPRELSRDREDKDEDSEEGLFKDNFELGLQLSEPQGSEIDDEGLFDDNFDLGVNDLLPSQTEYSSKRDTEVLFQENFDIGIVDQDAFAPASVTLQPRTAEISACCDSDFGPVKTSFVDCSLKRKTKKFNLCKK